MDEGGLEGTPFEGMSPDEMQKFLRDKLLDSVPGLRDAVEKVERDIERFPEHLKVLENSVLTQSLGDFLVNYLPDNGIILARRGPDGELEDYSHFQEPTMVRFIMGPFFGIDNDEYDREELVIKAEAEEREGHDPELAAAMAEFERLIAETEGHA